MPDSQLWGSPAPGQPLPHRHAWGTPIWRPDHCPQDCCQVRDLFRLYFGDGYFCLSLSVLLTDRLQKHQDQLVSKPAYKAKQAVAARQPLCAAGQRLPEPAAVLGRLLPAAGSRLPQTGTAPLPAPSQLQQLFAGLFCPLAANKGRSSPSSITRTQGSPGPGSRTSPRPGRPPGPNAPGPPPAPPRCPREPARGPSPPPRLARTPPVSHRGRAVASSSPCEFPLRQDTEPEAVAPQAPPPPPGSRSPPEPRPGPAPRPGPYGGWGQPPPGGGRGGGALRRAPAAPRPTHRPPSSS